MGVCSDVVGEMGGRDEKKLGRKGHPWKYVCFFPLEVGKSSKENFIFFYFFRLFFHVN